MFSVALGCGFAENISKAQFNVFGKPVKILQFMKSK